MPIFPLFSHSVAGNDDETIDMSILSPSAAQFPGMKMEQCPRSRLFFLSAVPSFGFNLDVMFFLAQPDRQG